MRAGKRAELVEKFAAIHASIDWKQDFCDDVLSGRTPYISNLLPKDAEAPAETAAMRG